MSSRSHASVMLTLISVVEHDEVSAQAVLLPLEVLQTQMYVGVGAPTGERQGESAIQQRRDIAYKHTAGRATQLGTAVIAWVAS